MSRTIDERVVELQFDNQQFEEGTKQSMNTLEKLKNSLNFSQATKNIQELETAGKNFNLDGIANAVDFVQQKFSYWEIVASSAIQNITWRIMNTLVPAIKSLTIGQIGVGWGKYADITQSIQTIMSATGKSMDYVSEQAEKLLWFTDETSFSLADMTSNISKFTSSGIELEKAIPEMMGISTASALAGASIQDASHAMMGFSKAIAQGYMGSNQWQWIQTAHLDTVEFKNALLEAAAAEGKLKKAGDGVYKTLKGNVITAENFGNLNEKWLTSGAMEKALSMYGDFANLLNEVYNETGLLTSDLLDYVDEYAAGTLDIRKVSEETGVEVEKLEGWFKKLGSAEMETGRKAFRAAQEAKTFGEAIGSVRDAVSTGWMKTFELIFGNYEEAKKLWTHLANELYDVFAEGGNTRNEILKAWHDNGGYERLFSTDEESLGAVWVLWNNILDIVNAVKDAFREVFPGLNADTLLAYTYRFKNMVEYFTPTEEFLETVGSVAKDVFSVFGEIADILEEGLIGPLLHALHMIKEFDDGAESVGDTITSAVKNINKAIKPVVDVTSNVFKRSKGVLKPISDGVKELTKDIKNASEATSNAWQRAKGILKPIEDVTTSVKELGDTTDKTRDRAENLHRFITGIAKIFSPIADTIKGLIRVGRVLFDIGVQIADGILSILGSTGDVFGDLMDKIHEGGIITNFFEAIAQVLERIRDSGVIDAVFGTLSRWIGQIKESKIISGIFETISGGLNKIKEFFSDGSASHALSDFFNGLKDAIKGLKVGDILKILAGIWAGLKLFKGKRALTWIGDFVETLGNLFGDLDDAVYALLPNMTWMTQMVFAILALSAAMYLLSKIDPERLFAAMSAIGMLVVALYKMVDSFSAKALSGGNLFNGVQTVYMYGKAMVAIGRAVLLLAIAVKQIASIGDIKTLIVSVLAVGALLAAVALTIKYISSFTDNKYGRKMTKGVGNIIFVAAAVLILTKAVKTLASLNVKELSKGLIGVGLLLAGIAGFIWATSKIDGGIGIGTRAGIIALALALSILSSSVKTFGELDDRSLGQGLAAVGVLLLGLIFFVKATDGAKGIFSASVGMIRLAAAMVIMAKATEKFAAIGLEGIVTGFIGLAGSLAMMVIAMDLMPTEGIISKSIAFIGMGVALKLVADAVATLDGMSLDSVANALVALGGALGEVVLAAIAISETNSELGAVAMVALAFAIKLMTPSLMELSSLSLEEVGAGLLALGGALVEVGAASIVLAPNLAVLIPLALSLVGISVGANLFASSIKNVADAMDIASSSINAFDSTLQPAAKNYKSYLTTMKTESETFIELLKGYVIEFGDIGRGLVTELVNGIIDKTPDAITAMTNLVNQALETAKAELGINSPSTAFAEIGHWIDEGLVVGLKESQNDIYGELGRISKNTIRGAEQIASVIENNLSEALEITANIIPVIDDKSVDGVMGYLSRQHPDLLLNVAGAANKAIGVDNLIAFNKNGKLEMNAPEGADIDGMQISFTQNNYSPKALSRMDIYRQTQNQMAAVKGMLKQ